MNGNLDMCGYALNGENTSFKYDELDNTFFSLKLTCIPVKSNLAIL